MIFHDFGMDTASLAGSLETKLAAVREAGFSQVMITAADVVGHPGGNAAGVRAVRGSGLEVTGLEALRDFEGLDGQLCAYKVDVAKSMLEICASLGGRLLLVEASTSRHASSDPEVIAGDLGRLAVMAVPLGIRIAYKSLPWSRTARDFREAADIVMRVASPNVGVAVDAFDVLASGVPQDDLDVLDPGQTFLVQISDYMWQEVRTAEEQAATATHFRVFPGDGAHSDALAQFVSRLDAIGYYGNYSFDVYNDDYLQMPPEVVAGRARRAAIWLAETVLRRALPVPNVERLRAAGGERVVEGGRAGNVPRRHHLLDVLDDQVGQHPLERRKHVADLRRDDGADRRMGDDFLERVREVLEHNDRRRARVLQLMLEFPRRIQWVSVYYHDARPLRPKQRNRVLQQVRQHDRHPVALLQAGDLLQVGREVAAQVVELAVGDRHAHVPVGRQVREPRAARLQDLLEGAVGRDVNFGGHPFRVLLQPDLFHRLRST